ncbi:MAG: protoporphyrinogen oxidase [Acidimicrobiia bacterium]|nr:MAG: protoporphyrinogen oxidase [Acidimicrobiia bacterium]
MNLVTVVGGGLAGLLTAAELLRRGVEDVSVLEAADRPGGVARGTVRSGHRLEPAVSTFRLPHPRLEALLDSIGVSATPALDASTTRHLFTRGRRLTVRPGPGVLTTPVVGLRAKLAALAEPWRRSTIGHDPSLEEFLVARFGAGLGRIAAWVAAAGVYAGDPDQLSARAAFPALTGLVDKSGSILRGWWRSRGPRRHTAVPVGGISALIDAVAGALGDRLVTSCSVEAVEATSDGWVVHGAERVRTRHLVLATPSHETRRILRADWEPTPRAPVAVIFLAGPAGSLPVPPGFGCLVDPAEGMATVGVVFETNLDPSRAPAGRQLVKVIAGGAHRPEVAEWDDDRLVARVGDEVARIVGADVGADLVEVFRIVPGIPQYVRSHLRRLEELGRHLEGPTPIQVTGWDYRGVGVADLAWDAARVADATTLSASSPTQSPG